MSTDRPHGWDDESDETASQRVTDEEGTVDEKLKARIINARQRVDDREDTVYIEAELDPDVSLYNGRSQIWGVAVRQYLRAIEPLLKSDKIDRSDHYYREIELVDRPVYPPNECKIFEDPTDKPDDETIQWDMFYQDGKSNTSIVKNNPLFGRGFEPPGPKRFTVTGLKDVIDGAVETFTWQVPLNPRAIPPEQKYLKTVRQVGMDKQTLENAVRKADDFLQQAGIGLEIGHQTKDEEDDTPF